MQEHSIGFNQYVHELVKGASYGGTIVNFDDKIERFFRMYTANRAVFTIYIRCKTASDLTNPRRVSERGLASNSIGNQEPPPEALTMPVPSAPRFFQIQVQYLVYQTLHILQIFKVRVLRLIAKLTTAY